MKISIPFFPILLFILVPRPVSCQLPEDFTGHWEGAIEIPGSPLAGTLALPQWEGPFPAAALLISGSGAQNRDSELFGHKPFLLIADFLTRAGIAVLRPEVLETIRDWILERFGPGSPLVIDTVTTSWRVNIW